MAAAQFSPVVVAPTYNHVGTLIDVLTRVQALDLPIIAVDDGSTDATAKRLAEWAAQPHRAAIHLQRHDRNRGKAAALHTGFEEAARLGYTHAITIDTDGQHDPADIPALLRAAEADPDALILGERSDRLANYPLSSMIGRRLTNFAIRIASGVRVSDSQCGLRIYPLRLIQAVRCRARRFAFESEIITRAAWAGWPLRCVPVTSWYAPAGQRISHFRGFTDSTQGVLLQCRLLLRAITPWPHRKSYEQRSAATNHVAP